MQQNRNSIIMDMICQAFNEDIAKKLKLKKQIIVRKFQVVLLQPFIWAVFSVGMKWLTNKNKHTKKELLKYLEVLIPDDLNSDK